MSVHPSTTTATQKTKGSRTPDGGPQAIATKKKGKKRKTKKKTARRWQAMWRKGRDKMPPLFATVANERTAKRAWNNDLPLARGLFHGNDSPPHPSLPPKTNTTRRKDEASVRQRWFAESKSPIHTHLSSTYEVPPFWPPPLPPLLRPPSFVPCVHSIVSPSFLLLRLPATTPTDPHPTSLPQRIAHDDPRQKHPSSSQKKKTTKKVDVVLLSRPHAPPAAWIPTLFVPLAVSREPLARGVVPRLADPSRIHHHHHDADDRKKKKQKLKQESSWKAMRRDAKRLVSRGNFRVVLSKGEARDACVVVGPLEARGRRWQSAPSPHKGWWWEPHHRSTARGGGSRFPSASSSPLASPASCVLWALPHPLPPTPSLVAHRAKM